MKRHRQTSLSVFVKKSKAVFEAPVENENDTEIISDNSDSEISHDPTEDAGPQPQAAALTHSEDNYPTCNDPSRDNQSSERG